jgi:AcrR family transcriptional regulator
MVGRGQGRQAVAGETSAGRPRDPDVDARVRDATLALLVERGYAGLRIDDVARASGVAKTTIYRRWPSLALLVLDAVEAALGPRDVPLTGDVEADLEMLVAVVHHSLVSDPVGRIVPAIGLDLLRQPDLAAEYRRRFVAPLREQAVALIRRGMNEGVFAADADPEGVVDAVAGTLVYRRLLGEPAPTLEALTAIAVAVLRPDRTSGRGGRRSGNHEAHYGPQR